MLVCCWCYTDTAITIHGNLNARVISPKALINRAPLCAAMADVIPGEIASDSLSAEISTTDLNTIPIYAPEFLPRNTDIINPDAVASDAGSESATTVITRGSRVAHRQSELYSHQVLNPILNRCDGAGRQVAIQWLSR